MQTDRVATGIALLITTVWTLSIILDATWRAYDPPATIHALMMAVAGWAFGHRYLGKRNKVDDELEGW